MSTSSPDRPKLAGLKYQVRSILSSDDQGTVTLIGDEANLGRPYALKFVKRSGPEDDALIDLARAACEASAKLGHKDVARYYDCRLKKKWFKVERAEMLMEYVDGKPLSKCEDLSLEAVILIAKRLAAALSHMHRRGVLHGDLEPRHVLLTKKGEVKVIGYGWSQLAPKFQGALPRSRVYLAPERLREKIATEKGDIYSLGALMYHLATGQPPVRGRTQDSAQKMTLPTRLNPAIPASFNNLIVACLQSDPKKRPEHMYEVQQRLEAILKERHLEQADLRGLIDAEGAASGEGLNVDEQ